MKTVEIILPVYYGNYHEIEDSVFKQVKCYSKLLDDYDWRITIAVNGPKADDVINLVKRLNEEYPRVWYTYSERAGKGSGVINTLLQSKSDIMIFMDIDLATDIKDIRKLIEPIENGSDMCIGSRYHPESVVTRSFKRKFISRTYNRLFARIVLGSKVSDLQCGFKSLSRKVVDQVIPLVRSRDWFFDTELLFYAQKFKYKISEVPVVWVESQFSGVKLYKAIWEFLTCSLELRFRK